MRPKWPLNDYVFFLEKSHQKPNNKKQNLLIQYSVARRGRGGAIAPSPINLLTKM